VANVTARTNPYLIDPIQFIVTSALIRGPQKSQYSQWRDRLRQGNAVRADVHCQWHDFRDEDCGPRALSDFGAGRSNRNATLTLASCEIMNSVPKCTLACGSGTGPPAWNTDVNVVALAWQPPRDRAH
jgi:hypothetical protein